MQVHGKVLSVESNEKSGKWLKFYMNFIQEYVQFGLKSVDKVHMGHVCVQVAVHCILELIG